jgi:hypothetical protein
MIKKTLLSLLLLITSYLQVTTYAMEPHRARTIWHRVSDVTVDSRGILHFKSYGQDIILKNDNYIIEPDETAE